MRRLYRIVPLIVALTLIFAASGVPTSAQGGGGGIVIASTFGQGPDTFNYPYCLRSDCLDVLGLIMPAWIGVDENNIYTKNIPGALVKDWTVSEDGKTITFTLKDTLKWSDGTPITSKDYLNSWNVIKDPKAESDYISATVYIEDVQAPNPTTVIVKFKNATCNAISESTGIPVFPAHVFADTDISKLKEHPFGTNPNVTFGPFKFKEFRPADQTILEADQNYPDKLQDKVKPDGFIYKVVPDQTVELEQFLAGETSMIESPIVGRRKDVRAQAAEGKVKIFDYPGDLYDYISLNMADPKNPQPALDKDGKRIDQGHHPVFGDKRVRQALARGIDGDAIIKGAVFGEGTRMATTYRPGHWALNPNLKPIAYDPKAAEKLLDEAGWAEKGPDGIRVAKGAMYAPDGTRLSFKLVTIQGNPRRTAIANLVKDQLKQIGVEVDFQPMEFNAMSDLQGSQTGDAFIGAWGAGDPNNADQSQFWAPESDLPGGGSNFVSFYNQELLDLMKKANTTPCNKEERLKMYYRIQEILQDETPYIFLHTLNGMYAYRSNVQGADPRALQKFRHIDIWSVTSAK